MTAHLFSSVFFFFLQEPLGCRRTGHFISVSPAFCRRTLALETLPPLSILHHLQDTRHRKQVLGKQKLASPSTFRVSGVLCTFSFIHKYHFTCGGPFPF